jgi:hypothetical protein
MGYTSRAVFTIAFLLLLASANTVFAQTTNANQTLLQSAYVNAACKTNFTTAFIGHVTTVVPSLGSLGQYSALLRGDASRLSALAAAGNITAYKNYVSGTYDPDLNRIAKNVSSAIRAANLTANTIATLRQNYNATLSSYKSCNLQSAKEYALQKLNMFNNSIRNYQEQASDLSSKGLDAGSLDLLLQNAQSQIVSPFENAINTATNASQIYAAINSYCLFDGCRNGTNFHLAAHFSLQSLSAQEDYLELNKNISTASLAPADTDLNNASSLLQTVGIKAYAKSQGDNIFDNLSAASKAMQQARKQDTFEKLKQAAEKELSNYQGLIANYRAVLAKLPSGVDTTQLNLTIAQAETQILDPLQAALNSSTNATQLYAVFQSYCLENNCRNGTNYHLAAKLKLGQAQAYLAYLELKANASSYVMINQTALASAESAISGASSLISSTGPAQYSQSQTMQLAGYLSNFTSALKNAFTANKSKLAAVNRTSVAAARGDGAARPNAVPGPSSVSNTMRSTTIRPTTTIHEKAASSVIVGGNTSTVAPTATANGLTHA